MKKTIQKALIKKPLLYKDYDYPTSIMECKMFFLRRCDFVHLKIENKECLGGFGFAEISIECNKELRRSLVMKRSTA